MVSLVLYLWFLGFVKHEKFSLTQNNSWWSSQQAEFQPSCSNDYNGTTKFRATKLYIILMKN